MPRAPRHAVTRCPESGHYELSSEGDAARRVRPQDAVAWWSWLDGVTSFAFRGAAGRLNVYREARPRGGHYWYAYHTAEGRTRKRYLGATTSVTLARLEEVALALAAPSPADVVPEGRPADPDGREDDVASALPVTKLLPPRPPSALVAREPVLGALDAASSSLLTLVVAPAGWGKTTALAAWTARHADRVAWLALELADDEPIRFWTSVIAALRVRMPRVGATSLAMLRAPQPPSLPAVVTALVNELAEPGVGAHPLPLVLDDYHLITDRAIHESVAFLVEHLPAGLRLVIASRADPDLPLARLRAGGRMLELRAADLRFSETDIATFLSAVLDRPLDDHEVAALAARTEGWAAGVQLAALALRGRADRTAWLAAFTGGHRFLLDYVEEEVLSKQSPAVRRFLLQVSVLQRLGADLCAAVTGDPASRDVLDTLERENLFVVPLDDERHWYRLHDLFREALLALAAAEAPNLLPAAHRRAAAWHAAHGDGREAIEHALAGEDHPLAADLIAREAPAMWLRGEVGTVVARLLELPENVLLPHARLALDAALRLLEAAYGAGGSTYGEAEAGAERMLARVETVLAERAATVPEAEAALLGGRVRLLRARMEAWTHVLHRDAVALRLLGAEADTLTKAEEVRWQMVALTITYWLTEAILRDGALLIPRLRTAKSRAIAADDPMSTSRVQRWLGYAYARAAQVRAAQREAIEALSSVERRGEHSITAGYLHYLRARMFYEWRRLDEADEALRQMFHFARTWQNTDLLIVGDLELVRLALARRDMDGARQALDAAESRIREARVEQRARLLDAERVRYWLAAGDLQAASDWAARADFAVGASDGDRYQEVLALVQVRLAQRSVPDALDTLERFRPQLDRPGDVWLSIQFRALHLLTLHAAGEFSRARATAQGLFALTEPEGILGVFLDAGEPMERALVALRDAPDGEAPGEPSLPRAYIERLLAAFREERRAERSPAAPAAVAREVVSRRGRAASGTVEPLTRREREVLVMLAAGASNKEIAAALAISLDTAKKHVGNLLAKLGATSRTQAVARARDAGMI